MTLLHPELFAIQVLEDLTAIREERDVLHDIWKALCSGEKEESVVKAISELC